MHHLSQKCWRISHLSWMRKSVILRMTVWNYFDIGFRAWGVQRWRRKWPSYGLSLSLKRWRRHKSILIIIVCTSPFRLKTAPLYEELNKTNDESSHWESHAKVKLHGKMKFPNTPTIRKTFEQLKKTLVSASIFIHADFDRELSYIHTCYEGVAGTFHQIPAEDNKKHPILKMQRMMPVIQ